MTVPEPLQVKNQVEQDSQHALSLRDLFTSLADISSVSSLPELMPHLARLLATSVGAQRCSMFLFNFDMTRIVEHLRWGYSDEEFATLQATSVQIDPTGNDVIQHVASTGEIYLRTPDETPAQLQPSNLHDRGVLWPGDMVVPFIWNDRVEGVAYVLLPDGAERFDALQVEIAQGVARQAAGIINHLRAAEAERRSRRQTEMLLGLSQMFNLADSTQEIYNGLADAVHTTMELDAVSIVVRETSILSNQAILNRRVVAVGLTDDEVVVRDAVLRRSTDLDSTIDRLAVSRNEPVVVSTIGESVDDTCLRESFASEGVTELLAVPINMDGMLHGVLYGWRRNRQLQVDDDQLHVVGAMAKHAAASLERLRLVDSERHLRQSTETLADVHRAFAVVDEPLSLLHIATGAIRRALGADLATATLHISDGDTQHCVITDGATNDDLATLLPVLACDVSPPDRQEDSDGPRVLSPERLQTLWTGSREDGEEGGSPAPEMHAIEVPLVIHMERAGSVLAWFRNLNTALLPTDMDTSGDIARDVARAIERVTLRASERHQWNRAEMLRSFSEVLNRAVELPAVTSSIQQAVQSHLPGAHAAIALQDESAQTWRIEPELPFATGQEVADLLQEALQQRAPLKADIETCPVLAVPLTAGTESLGALVIARSNGTSISKTDLATVTSLAPQAADAIQRARLHAVSERTIAELRFLHEVGRTISQRQNLTDILDYISVEINKLVNYSTGFVALEEQGGQHLHIMSVWGDTPYEGLGMSVPVDASIIGTVYLTHEPVVIDNVLEHPAAWGKDIAVWQSLICVPLMTGSRAIGTLLLGHHEPGMFSREDLRLASLLAGQAGAAVYQARESERQRELYRAGVEALAAAVDAKDSYIHSHSRQVAELSRRTAEALGLDVEEVERIELAGLLHDVGKIGIPDHILTKPGRLDSQERLVMISHATLGAGIVAAHPALAEMSDIVLHHHEWHNGGGYPDGLRADEVPIGSAIISVADAYDSMTTYRSYRKALSFKAARDELMEWSGRQFHPRVVDAFLSWIEEEELPEDRLTGQSLPLRPIQSVDIVGPRVMSQVAIEIDKLTDLYPFLGRVQEIIQNELRYEEVNLFILDETGDHLILGASTANGVMSGRLRVAIGEGIAGQVARTRCPVNCGDVVEDDRAGYFDIDMRSVLAVPLVIDDDLIGVLGAGSTEPHRFDDRDTLQLELIARQIASTVMVAQLHDHTRLAATTDGLTGVMNHRAFYHRLEAMISNLDHWDDELHLLIVDVIGLKAVNDIHGHLAGDRALIAVANALKSRVRNEDEIARYGGDEFVVIVRGTPRAGLDELVQRLSTPVDFTLGSGHALSVRLRCGVATAHSSAERATELVARADAGLYADVQPTERDRA